MRAPRLLLGVATGATALLALSAPASAAQAGPTGSAFAVQVSGAGAGGPLAIGPAPAASHPGTPNASADLAPQGITAAAVSASADQRGLALISSAGLGGADVLGVVRAGSVNATCATDGKVVNGRTSLQDVTVAGQALPADAKGTLTLGPTTVVVDEQTTTPEGVLTITALRVTVNSPVGKVDKGEIVLGRVTCAKAAGGNALPQAPAGTGSPTGGGSPEAVATTAPAATATTAPVATTVSPPSASQGPLIQVAGTTGGGGGSTFVPIAVGAAVLLVGGGIALLVTRRRKASN
ncbi:hypothetical protein [Actinokineospora bangkokensis]|uniref:Gram-positive cocci surface proteins LPxTG domain-containing protein n=1 Tax=Actinokineospora bangkokensis TaxID=1193682 RepID=A0A1Q9LJG8_9PSEU|nr:hypothetical protein [Actinokineospora bangkokensis]OLR92145.1 hypothetical protein BJP25_22670 [Actinokineospora bangkokensis]